jgi:hypothetical protein
MKEEILSRYSTHSLDVAGIAKLEHIRQRVRQLAFAIEEYCPEGKEKEYAFQLLLNVMTTANCSISQAYPISASLPVDGIAKAL